MPALDFSYPLILEVLGQHLTPGRTESHAFLAWFLENYYRLEEIDAQDCICDGFDDKGIDAIYIDENLNRIDVFQSKLLQNNDRTVGDTPLREFVGTMAQFKDPDQIESIASTTSNSELANLLRHEKVADKIQQNYEVWGIFVTNSDLDSNGQHYLSGQSRLAVYDRAQLQKAYVSFGPTGPIQDEKLFDVLGFDCPEYRVGKSKMVIAPLLGSELIQMAGIANQELFAWNVRQSLGRTKVNKAIEKSILDSSEHKHFLFYHNGLTVLCESIDNTPDRIKISGYTVVNGCQSLTTIYENQKSLSGDLRIITRLIKVSPESELAAKITDRTNNQNGTTPRDHQSNSAIQRRLQAEFNTKYRDAIFYRIKRGEETQSPQVIDNDVAARILLAFDLQEPWTCHQSYKLFDELHARIFARREITAERIVSLHDLYEVVIEQAPTIEIGLFGGYTLTKFFLLHLIRGALEADTTGQQFCQQPSQFILEDNGRIRMKDCVTKVLQELIIELNSELKELEEGGNPFDYKRALKSPSEVRSISNRIISNYKRLVNRGRVPSFGEGWRDST